MKTLSPFAVFLRNAWCFSLAVAASCATPAPSVKAASAGRLAGPPTFQQSWTQPFWYVDPQNVTGCADDTNGSCGSRTCVVGDGPCKSYQGVAAKWGTYAPRIAQNTTLTFLSGQTDSTDPVIFQGTIENGAQFYMAGPLGAAQTICSGTLSGVVAKNVTTPQLLNATLCTAATTNQLVVNTNPAHSSAAWTYKVVSGHTFSFSQPQSPVIEPQAYTVNVDTWANLDAYTVYAPVAVNIVDLEPILTTNASANSELTVFNLSTLNNLDYATLGNGVSFDGGLIQKSLNWKQSTPGGTGFFGSDVQAAASNSGNSVNFVISGGIIAGAGASTFDYPIILNDTILAKGPSLAGAFFTGNVYVETGQIVLVQAGGLGSGQTGVLYGAGSLNVGGTQVWNYTSPASTAFPQATLLLNAQSTACSLGTGAAAAWNCGITLTKAHLDAAFGVAGFGGLAINPGGASFSNTFF
jgi:hypothetical protein